MHRIQIAALLLLVHVGTLPAQAPVHRPIDWPAMEREAVEALREYLRIDTSNPPGNELASARWLQRFLAKEGIEAQVLDTVELGAGRANLYARLRGDGSRRAIALVQHMDVVPVSPAYWTVPAFDGVLKDGYIYGRGALDMKGEGIAHLMALVALKRSGVHLTRDIVFIANADEELGSTGAVVFVDRHADLLRDVEYLLTEGGGNVYRNGTLQYYGVGVAEKRTFWNRMTVRGTPSHGSRPTRANPVPRLVRALDRIARHETPLQPTPAVQKYFRDISRSYTGHRAAWLRDVTVALRTKEARDWILTDVYWNAILRNTIAITGLQGSPRTNVIPAVATADLDIRLLPNERPEEMLATLTRIVDDTAVHFTTILPPKPPFASPTDTELFRAIERAAREHDPHAFVTSSMMTGATDRPTYRRLGIVTYGLSPFKVEAADEQRGVHGNDERLSVTSLGAGVRFVYDILRYAQ